MNKNPMQEPGTFLFFLNYHHKSEKQRAKIRFPYSIAPEKHQFKLIFLSISPNFISKILILFR